MLFKLLTIEQFTSFYVLDFCSSQDLVDFACKLLESDTQSETLSILAGELNPEMSVVAPLFDRVLNELHFVKPNKLQAQLIVAHYYAKNILAGDITPFEGACELWNNITNRIDNPSKLLLLFVGAASEIEDLSQRYKNDNYDPTPQIKSYEKQIIEAAGTLLQINNPFELLKFE